MYLKHTWKLPNLMRTWISIHFDLKSSAERNRSYFRSFFQILHDQNQLLTGINSYYQIQWILKQKRLLNRVPNHENLKKWLKNFEIFEISKFDGFFNILFDLFRIKFGSYILFFEIGTVDLYMGIQKENESEFELSHQFELKAQTQ